MLAAVQDAAKQAQRFQRRRNADGDLGVSDAGRCRSFPPGSSELQLRRGPTATRCIGNRESRFEKPISMTPAFERLQKQLKQLPGLGYRSAERIALHLLVEKAGAIAGLARRGARSGGPRVRRCDPLRQIVGEGALSCDLRGRACGTAPWCGAVASTCRT